MTTTQTQIQDLHPRYRLGFQSDRAEAANAALFAGQEIFDSARAAWARVRDVLGEARGPLDEAEPVEVALRRNAVALDQAARTTLGLASTSACGLWGITAENRIFQVDATDGGSDYLRGVRFVAVAHLRGESYEPVLERKGDEYPVREVVAFFDSYDEAHEFRSPSKRGFFGSVR